MRRKYPRVLLALGWYEPRLHQGIAQYAIRAGWHLHTDITKEKDIPWGWKGDGILAWLAAGDDLARFVVEAKVPTVDFSFRRPHLRFPRVLSDHAATAALAAEHFRVRGFTNYLYYSARDNWTFNENGQAFVSLLKQAGHVCPWIRWHESTSYTTGRSQWQHKRRWLATQLKKAPKPLALYAASDDHALEVVETCEAIGISVPEQISVIGREDSLPAVEALRTPISSVNLNFEAMGFRGAELLDQLMRGKPAPVEPIRIPPVGLIARKSSDLLAIRHPGVARSLKYLWAHCDQPISVDTLAKVAGMSRSGLHQAYLEHIGRPPGTELHRVRIERAKQLLAEPQLKLDEVAERCGYQSGNSFWVSFKQSTGVSPRKYQKTICH